MSTDVTTEVTIRRPRQEVASFVMDPANDAVWLTGIQESRQLTEPPVGKGTKVERVARFLGRRMSYVTEVVEHEAGSVIVMKSDSPFPMTITYRFEEAPEGTRMRAHLQGDGGGFYRLAAPLLSRAVKRQIASDLAGLKTLLETRDADE